VWRSQVLTESVAHYDDGRAAGGPRVQTRRGRSPGHDDPQMSLGQSGAADNPSHGPLQLLRGVPDPQADGPCRPWSRSLKTFEPASMAFTKSVEVIADGSQVGCNPLCTTRNVPGPGPEPGAAPY
jgi:hypothetical protein